MKSKLKRSGFTLVELLIVISLIAILSVAVLATINPIEQANKARDSRVQNDAAEVMNAYERYYASNQEYPWNTFKTGTPPAPYVEADDPVLLRSDYIGFGICSGAATDAVLKGTDPTTAAGACSASDAAPNLLISTSELKGSFAGKDEFDPVLDGKLSQALWVAKAEADTSIYVCYIPKADANRKDPTNTKLRCLTQARGQVTRVAEDNLDGATCGVAAADQDWDVPVLDGSIAMFKCVPE